MRHIAVKLSIVSLAVLGGGVATSTAEGNSSQASWYGPGLYGNHMACGGVLTTSTWGVAHKTLRCGTKLTICYSRCAVVTVIDRGPYVYGRDFDLTSPVKNYIGMPDTGTVSWWYGAPGGG